MASSATFALNSAVNRLRVFMVNRLRHQMETFVRGEDLDSDNAYALTDHIYRVQRLASDEDNWDIDFQKKGVKGG
jgi:hypothetical protein